MSALIPAEETFDGTWPYTARYGEAAGFRQHYVDEGPQQPEHTLVLLHGEPTWGYEWRHLIGPLSQRNRVIVPDHMGFGKSATPSDRTYLVGEHIDNLEKLLVDTLDLTDITLVLRDWGGAIGTGFALRHPDRVARIFATNTVLPLGLDGFDQLMAANVNDSPWFQWVRAAITDGSFEQILGNAGHTITHLMMALQTIARPQIATPTWIRAYSSPFPTPAECRGVIRFPQQFVVPEPDPALKPPDPDAVAALRAKPAMLVEGMRDTALIPRHMIPAFRLAYPDAPVIELPEAGHFTPEDAPETLLALLQLFLQTPVHA
ncbi:alpha/beta fold hydrolase [Streptomyces pseudoechinosporeus]